VFNMAPEGTVSAQFVKGHPPVSRNPDRLFHVDLRRSAGAGSAALIAKFHKGPDLILLPWIVDRYGGAATPVPVPTLPPPTSPPPPPRLSPLPPAPPCTPSRRGLRSPENQPRP